jgi:hypothetical protein
VRILCACNYIGNACRFLFRCRQMALQFEACIATKSGATCRNFLQTYWKIPTIHETLLKTIEHLAATIGPSAIQGYYASISEELHLTQQKACFHQQYTLFDLLRTHSQLQVAIFEFRDNIESQTITTFANKLQSHGWTTSLQTIKFETHSDQIGGSATFMFAFNSDFYTSPAQSNIHIRASPPIPNSFQSVKYKPFNTQTYCIPIDNASFRIKVHHDRTQRRPSVASTIEMCNFDTPQLGYQIFDQDNPAPLPSNNQEGFFGPLFGVNFHDPISNKEHIRSISIAEYVATFGYDSSFNTKISKTLQNPCLLRQTIPARTMTAITTKLQGIVTIPINALLTAQAERYDIDLSIPALFN